MEPNRPDLKHELAAADAKLAEENKSTVPAGGTNSVAHGGIPG